MSCFFAKYHLSRMKMSLSQLSLKYIGSNILSIIPEILKYLSPYSIGKQCKNVLLSCQNSCWFCFICLPLFCNITFSTPPFLSIFHLSTYSPHPFIWACFPYLLFLLFCLRIFSDVDWMHFFLLLHVKHRQ